MEKGLGLKIICVNAFVWPIKVLKWELGSFCPDIAAMVGSDSCKGRE